MKEGRRVKRGGGREGVHARERGQQWFRLIKNLRGSFGPPGASKWLLGRPQEREDGVRVGGRGGCRLIIDWK